MAWAIFPSEAVTISGKPARYNSSGDVHRSFCGRCGTGLFYESDTAMPGKINLRVAMLDQPGLIAPRALVQLADAPEWLHRLDDLPKMQRYAAG